MRKLADYTKKIMVEFYKLGYSTARWGDNDISGSAAQSRLHNSARRLGVRVKTRRTVGGIVGRIIGYPYNKDTMLYQLGQHGLAEMVQQFGMTESVTTGSGFERREGQV